ncbi:MAG: hypothetical protein HQ515_18145 [Phycisphaeraceae bacterium]|nr:hypothetical protein [Phycisphaeraceae bacterium]
MKNHMNMKFVAGSTATLVLALAVWSPILQSAEHPSEHPSKNAKMKSCQAMTAEKQKLAKDLKAQDSELNRQVARMNRAPANKKVDLMAAIITRLVTQRTVMNARQARLQEGMMQHVAQHIQMGKESLSQCSVIKGAAPQATRRREHPDHPEHPKKK